MQVTRYSAPSRSSSSSGSVSVDYSGMDEHIQRQDALGAARDAKFAALYDGDVKGGIGAGNRIRDLLKAVRTYSPEVDERDPVQMVSPLARVTSTSSSNSSSGDGGSVDMEPEDSGTAPVGDQAGRGRRRMNNQV